MPEVYQSRPLMDRLDGITAEMERAPRHYGFFDSQEVVAYAQWIVRESVIKNEGEDIKTIQNPEDLLKIYPLNYFRPTGFGRKAMDIRISMRGGLL